MDLMNYKFEKKIETRWYDFYDYSVFTYQVLLIIISMT